jgi:hypothetical protein
MPSTPPPTKLKVEFIGFRELQRKLDDSLFQQAWRDGLTDITELVYSHEVVRAPVRSGRLVSRMEQRVQNKPIPSYAVVRTQAKNPNNGYAYPRRLNFDPRSRWNGWFLRVAEATKPAWEQILQRVAARIESRWSR